MPRAGGLFDQQYYHIMLIRAGLRAFALREEADNKKAAAKSESQSRRR